MTVIVAYKDHSKGITYVGGDSRRSMYGGLVVALPKKSQKVFGTGGIVLGHTGAGRIRNITQRLNVRFGPNGPAANFDLEEALVMEIIPEIKRVAQDRGYLLAEKGKIPDLSGMILVAIGTQLCVIGSDFGVTPISSDFYAIGSGQKIALGAMEIATKHTKLKPKQIVREALKASAKHIASVGPPYVIMKTAKLPTKNTK